MVTVLAYFLDYCNRTPEAGYTYKEKRFTSFSLAFAPMSLNSGLCACWGSILSESCYLSTPQPTTVTVEKPPWFNLW